MDDESCHPMLSKNFFRLRLPQIDGAFIQQMEQSVILSGCDRNLQCIPDEVGHHGAATTNLGIEMGDVGHRHVVRKSEIGVPVRISIQHRRAKACTAKLIGVASNTGGPAKKFGAVIEETSVVIQILNYNF